MTPGTPTTWSGDPLDAAAFLQELAAAADWQECADTIWAKLPHVLPGVRVDIYIAGPDERAALLFSSIEQPVVSPDLGSATLDCCCSSAILA